MKKLLALGLWLLAYQVRLGFGSADVELKIEARTGGFKPTAKS
jgi:hypothetical protein